MKTVLANDLILDDRSTESFQSTLGTQWRLVTDQVMGGISNGRLTLDLVNGKNCLRMQGDVSVENNGGFVQMVLPLSDKSSFDATPYSGILIEVAGNNEDYNLHVRTADLWLPWQSYRASFYVTEGWQIIRIPFSSLTPYKTFRQLGLNKLKRIGLVAIGRNFHADLCLASIRFYDEKP